MPFGHEEYLAGARADMVAVGRRVEYASHEATGPALEQTHDNHSRKMADEKPKLQYQHFQQQYAQEQAKLQHDLQSQLSDQKPGLHVPPPIPQHSRPGAPQPGQAPQPQNLSHELKYENFSNSVSYQPAPHQQQFPQPLPSAKSQINATVLHYQPIQRPQRYIVTDTSQGGNMAPQSYPSEKSPAYTFTAHQESPPEDPPPLPQYSNQEPTLDIYELPAEVPEANDVRTGLSTMHVDLPPPPTVEEEILFLKARLLQLEIEKGEAAALQAPPAVTKDPTLLAFQSLGYDVGRKESQPSLTVTTISAPESQAPVQSQQHSYPSPRAPPPLPPRSPNMASQKNFPQPPPSPRPQLQTSLPPPPPLPALYTYQPQNYPLPPPSPNRQSQQLSQFQRHDNSSYSNATSPSPSNRLSQAYFPGQTGYPASLQTTSHSPRSYNPSLNPYQPSPMSPAPPPYFPPPPGAAAITGKDNFSQGGAPSSANTGGQNYQRQSLHGAQGWQWGTPAPVGASVQPNYGPPPPIPSPWRG